MKHTIAALWAVFFVFCTSFAYAKQNPNVDIMLLAEKNTAAPDKKTKTAPKDSGEVVVYNWSEYIPQSVLNDFTKETGIKVVYSTYESNEAMYAKVRLLKGRSYDIVVPSTYFIDIMLRDGLLLKLDHSKIKGLENIDPKLMNQAYDPGNQYSIPYMWGSMGMMINTKYIPSGSINSWHDLLRPEFKGKVMLSDDMRDVMGAALKACGKSMNATSNEDLEEAYNFLVKLRPSVRVFDITAAKQAFVSEEVIIGTSWNGDAIIAQEENPALEFIYPKEGVMLWVDSFAITSGAANIDNAYAFINYLLRPEVAKRCMDEYMYSTPNMGTLKLLSKEELDNRILNPADEDLKNSEIITDVGPALSLYEKYWNRLKTLK